MDERHMLIYQKHRSAAAWAQPAVDSSIAVNALVFFCVHPATPPLNLKMPA